MICQLVINDRTIPYTLKRSARRRTIGLKVDHQGLTVTVPQNASAAFIEQALNAKTGWILKTVDKLQEQIDTTTAPLSWHDGTIFPYLGKDCRLQLVTTLSVRNRFTHTNGWLTLETANADTVAVAVAVKKWLRRQAQEILLSRLADQADTMQLTYTEATLSNAVRRWGSCTAKRHIRLNWRLILTDWSLMDYVIIHELAHLIELNHSPKFWAIVETWYPDWRDARQKLNALGSRLFTLFPD